MTKTVRAATAATLTAVVIAAALLTATAAQAHYTYIQSGGDLMSVSSTHSAFSVCDRSNDGRFASGWVTYRNGVVVKISDTFNAYCASYTVPASTSIRSFRLCKNWETRCTT